MVDYEGLYRQHINRFKLTQIKQAIGLCPFHDESNPSFSMNLDTGLYLCHSCGDKGNAYQFAEAMNHPNPKDWIDNEGRQSFKSKESKEHLKVDLGSKAKGYQKNLPKDWIDDNPQAKVMLVGKEELHTHTLMNMAR